MKNDSNDANAISEDYSDKTYLDLDIKTLNPEKDLLSFLKEMNLKLSSNDVKYPNVRIINL